MNLLHLKYPLNKFAVKLAAFSACLGILFVLLFLITRSDFIAVVGFYHLIPTVIVHLAFLICIVFNAITHPKDLTEHFLTLFIMLLNIPLAIACAYIVLDII